MNVHNMSAPVALYREGEREKNLIHACHDSIAIFYEMKLLCLHIMPLALPSFVCVS